MNLPLQRLIRRGQADDVPAVVSLLEAAGLPTSDLTDVRELKMWVAEAADALIGIVALEPFGSQALLRSLAVVPEYRKRGLGQELVARLERDAEGEGIEQLVLLTETAESFFRRIGYEVTDRRSVRDEVRQSAEFRSLCPVSAVCMTKALRA